MLVEHPRILIGTDDMYEKIYWGSEPFVSLLTVAPELYDRTVTINGVSKAYAMTGWRIGYCGGPKEIVTAMATIQGQSTSNASSISQKAALAALNGDQQCVSRHESRLQGAPRLSGRRAEHAAGCVLPAGRRDLLRLRRRARSDAQLWACATTMPSASTCSTRRASRWWPGSGFGAPGHMRLSFACSKQTLEKAIERMRAVLPAVQAQAQDRLERLKSLTGPGRDLENSRRL